MNTLDAMKFSKSSIIKVIDELRDRTNKSWDLMICQAESDSKFLAYIDDKSKHLTDTDAFADPKHHRFAAIMALVRYLGEFAKDQGDMNSFNKVTRSIIEEKEKKATLEELLTKIMPTIGSKLSPSSDDKGDAEDRW